MATGRGECLITGKLAADDVRRWQPTVIRQWNSDANLTYCLIMEPFNTQALFGRDAAAAQRLENKVKVQHLKHDRAMLEWQEAEQQCAAKKELAHQALIELHQAEVKPTYLAS